LEASFPDPTGFMHDLRMQRRLIARVCGQPRDVDDRRKWQVVSAAAGAGAALAVRRVAMTAWRRWRHEEPPQHPGDRNVTWADALIWAIAAAVGAAVARVVAERAAAAAWTAATGDSPPAWDSPS
jgi:hypothetical protein